MTTTTTDAPFFSIICPLYNREKHIAAAIQSVLDQTFSSWELIIVDDGSTDNSVSIVNKEFGNHPQIKLLQQANKKQAAARNTGIRHAKGQWIAFIDSDDLWLPRKLELQYQCISKNGQIDVVFSDGYTKFQNSRVRVYYHYDIVYGFFRGHDLYKKLLFGNLIPILSLAIKSDWIVKVGEQDETVSGVEDHDYCLRLCREGANFYGMTDRLFEYHVHDNNFSGDIVKQHYISSGIRIKNYEPRLLDRQHVLRFQKLLRWYLNYFRLHGKPEWVAETKRKLQGLSHPSISKARKLYEPCKETGYLTALALQRYVKALLYFALKIIYFYPKKVFSGYKDRVFSRYVRWLGSGRISPTSYLQLSSTANIIFSRDKGIAIDVKTLSVGEYCQINFGAGDSGLIGGVDIVLKNYCNLDIRGQLIIGNNVLFDNGSMISCFNEIVIGDDCYFGEGSKIYDYHYDNEALHIPFVIQTYSTRKIKIGNNVRIGRNAVILPGAEIGDGCVIGSNRVVGGSLPANTVVGDQAASIVIGAPNSPGHFSELADKSLF